MFAVVRSLLDLIRELIGGVFRLTGTVIGSSLGLVLAAMILTGLIVLAVLH